MVAKATGTNKTTAEIRDKADKDTFVKDFLVYVDDSSTVADEIHENNKAAVITEAIQRGVRQDGEVNLDSSEIKDEHNVLLTYSVDVKSADSDK